MLTQDILNALKSYTENMQNDVCFMVQTGEHAKRAELLELLSGFASISDRISVADTDEPNVLRSPVSFYLAVDGVNSGVIFSGVPGGHEFNSLVLAVLHVSGTPLKLDDGIQQMISRINSPLNFEVFVSLSCHNCPDVVQALNQFASLNDNIKAETIDGGVYPELVDERNVQGVPAVFLNGEPFANGKIDTAKLLDKLVTEFPDVIGEASQEPSLPVQDMTIIGGGPAGVGAAIYGARKGLKVTMVADRFGGQVKDTMGIENLISVSKTTGPELVTAMQTHMSDYDVTLKEHLRVDRIENADATDGTPKRVVLSSGEVIETKTLIVATGARWRELGVPGEKENIGNGVAYCPHCDGPFFKGKDVAVIGGGNSGVEAALDLAGIVKSVKVFEFLPELKADQVLVDQLAKRDNITVYKNAATKQILAENDHVVALEYQDRATEETHQVDLSGVFVQIGLVPNSAFLKDVVELSPYGEVVVDARCETSAPGIFACGDVTTVPYKQIVVAMGEGSKAALAAFDYLLKSA